jgi:hypothetical protein
MVQSFAKVDKIKIAEKNVREIWHQERRTQIRDFVGLPFE